MSEVSKALRNYTPRDMEEWRKATAARIGPLADVMELDTSSVHWLPLNEDTAYTPAYGFYAHGPSDVTDVTLYRNSDTGRLDPFKYSGGDIVLSNMSSPTSWAHEMQHKEFLTDEEFQRAVDAYQTQNSEDFDDVIHKHAEWRGIMPKAAEHELGENVSRFPGAIGDIRIHHVPGWEYSKGARTGGPEQTWKEYVKDRDKQSFIMRLLRGEVDYGPIAAAKAQGLDTITGPGGGSKNSRAHAIADHNLRNAQTMNRLYKETSGMYWPEEDVREPYYWME